MPSDARRVRQHTGAEIPARGDARAADRAAKHRKHLVEQRETLAQLVSEIIFCAIQCRDRFLFGNARICEMQPDLSVLHALMCLPLGAAVPVTDLGDGVRRLLDRAPRGCVDWSADRSRVWRW